MKKAIIMMIVVFALVVGGYDCRDHAATAEDDLPDEP